MRFSKEILRFYAVTDPAWAKSMSLYEQVAAALRGGVSCVQLREKNLAQKAFLSEAEQMKALCLQYGVPLIIDDDAEVARAAGADGLHVGQEDLPAKEARRILGEGKILGVSVQTTAEALQAENDGADYLGVGAVFPTATKSDAKAVSLAELQEICQTVQIPVVAIGGIHRENMQLLAKSGIAGVALVSEIFSQSNIEGNCRELSLLTKQLFYGDRRNAE